MLLRGKQDFAARGHDSFDANRLVMVTLRQATRSLRIAEILRGNPYFDSLERRLINCPKMGNVDNCHPVDMFSCNVILTLLL
jgi:hypothetical protein